MRVRHILCCGTAMVLSATANGAVINLIDQGGVTGSAAEAALEIAASYWESILTNDVTIDIGVNYASLSGGVLASTNSSLMDYATGDWVAGVTATASDSTLDTTVVLPTVNATGGVSLITNRSSTNRAVDTGVTVYTEGETTSSQILYVQTALVKAIGGTATYDADNTAKVDATLSFSSRVAYDFDPSDGIADDAIDFIGVAIHEIAHALGFDSGIDALDAVGYPNGPDSDEPNLNDTSIFSAVDMFRYSTDVTDAAPGDDPVIDLSVGASSYFSIDGGKTALYANEFATGTYHGDGDQAAHWKENGSCSTSLGVMDPSNCTGQANTVTALDLAAMDAIGWNLGVDALAEPGYSASTADIYRRFAAAVPEPATWATMLVGLAMIGGVMRRRSRVAVRVAFAG